MDVFVALVLVFVLTQFGTWYMLAVALSRLHGLETLLNTSDDKAKNHGKDDINNNYQPDSVRRDAIIRG
jgi:hypothetical protein